MNCLRFQLMESLETEDGEKVVLPPPKVLSMIEWSPVNQKELLILGNPENLGPLGPPDSAAEMGHETCLFGDIGDPGLISLFVFLCCQPVNEPDGSRITGPSPSLK